jgi:glycopeptide antibiotics resistance protein
MIQFLAWAGTSVGLAVVACAIVLVAWLAIRRLSTRHAPDAYDLLVALTLVTVLVITLRPGNATHVASRWQLLPFRDLLLAIPDGWGLIRLALADLIGNVLLFMPLGAASALRWPHAPARRVLLAAALLSTAIELIQGVTATGRMAQTTDVLMNTLGAWLGWLVIVRVAQLRRSGTRFSDAVPRRR